MPAAITEISDAAKIKNPDYSQKEGREKLF
jgi:hypothetical protein